MALEQLLAFAFALGLAAFIPGPGITTLVARTVAGGVWIGIAALVGLILGDLVYLSFAVFGLVLLVDVFSHLLLLIKIGATLYLILLAWRFWHSQTSEFTLVGAPRQSDLWSSVWVGFAVTIANPKTITFYLALVPLVIDLTNMTIADWALGLVPVSIGVLVLVGGFYIIISVSAQHILHQGGAQKYIYRAASIAMLVAAFSMIQQML